MVFFITLSPTGTLAEESLGEMPSAEKETQAVTSDAPEAVIAEPEKESIRAKVIEILEEKTTDQNGVANILQRIKLKGIDGSYKDKEFIFEGIKQNITTKQKINKNETVRVTVTKASQGEMFIIDDIERLNWIYILIGLFVIIVLIVGKTHGLRSLLALFLTVILIFKFTVPRIMAGNSPILVTFVSAMAIIFFSILIVYGLKKKSWISIAGILAGVSITTILSVVFSNLTKLTGLAEEETMYLTEIFKNPVSFEGLMLASFVLGALGVLDDVAVTQTSTVEEIKKANPELKKAELYKRSMKVGFDHISSMINTLFLAYVGASFVLILLFSLQKPPFETITDVLNNEIVAIEIVRTLVGSIGLILTVPITSYIASYFYSLKKNK